MWQSIISAESLNILSGILSGPVAFFRFRFLIILLICSVVACGMSNVLSVLILFLYLKCLNDFDIYLW